MSSRGKSNHATEASILALCISDMLSKDGYVDSDRVLNQLNGVISAARLPQFIEIQRINKMTNSGIQVFKNTKAIQFYHELEAHLVTTYRGQKKLAANDTSITCFLDIGVGYLSCHPDVKAIFGFQGYEISSTLPRLELQQVLELAQRFFWKRNHMFFRSYNSIDWNDIQLLFQKTLCSQYGIQPPTGIFVQFKDLVPHFRKIRQIDTKNLTHQSQRLISEALVKLEAVLDKSIQSLCRTRNDSFDGICYLMNQTGFDVKSFYSQTRELLANEYEYEVMEKLLFDKYFPPRYISSDDQQGFYFTANPTTTIKTLSRCMATLLLLLLKYVSPKLPDSESIGDLIRYHLGNNVTQGIPYEIMDSTFQYLKAILRKNSLGLSADKTVDPHALNFTFEPHQLSNQ
jgi:hypothetical protein